MGSADAVSSRPVRGNVEALPYVAVAAILVTFGSILLATVVADGFVWTEHALSDLGVTTSEPGTDTTVLLFNGGLITGGIVGVVFAGTLVRRFERRADRLVAAVAVVAFAALGLIGVFPTGEPLHLPVAITHFLFISVLLGTEGVVRYRVGEHRWGIASVAGAIANAVVWTIWFLVRSDPFVGIAIPELLGALMFAVWLPVFAARIVD
jgi:hypothetical membrane protein